MEKYALAKILPIVFVILFALIAGGSLLHSGLPPTHDGEYHVIRFYEFDKVLRSGTLYPRWAPDLNNGYGVPLFNYVYPLPNYIASLFHFVGVSFIDTFKLNMVLALLLGAVFMYFLAKMYWGIWGGILASVFYTFAPYHLLDIYIRGSVGEVWALAFFPALLFSIKQLDDKKKSFFMPIASLLFCLVIFSHNIQALLFFPFVLSYIFFLSIESKDKKQFTYKAFSAVIIGLGLSTIFWLPAIFERQFVRGLEIFDYKRHFVELYQLIFPSWGSGFSADPTTEGLSFQIGIANLIILFISLTLLVCVKNYRKIAVVKFIIIWIMLSVFFMLPISESVWEKLPFIQYFQFPWRFLSLIILGSSFLAGSIMSYRKSKLIFLILLVLAVFSSFNYTKPAYYHMRDDAYYTSRSNFIDGTNSPGNAFNTVWFNEELLRRTSFSQEVGQTVTINRAYFPGWQAFINGKKVETKVDKDGLISIDKPAQKSTIEIRFLDTPIRTIASLISLAFFSVSCVLLIHNLRVRMRK